MSIRLRLTLLYSAILALTLIAFGLLLYTIQARYTLNSLKNDLQQSSNGLYRSLLWRYEHPNQPESSRQPPPPMQLDSLPDEIAFNQLREREIVRVLDPAGQLIASPFGIETKALPLSTTGLSVLLNQKAWWQITEWNGERLLIYNRPGIHNDQVVFIVQSARPLTERDRTLVSLGRTLLIAGVLTTMAAFGVGWVLAGASLRSIKHITQTAQEIGRESDFTRRVDYVGPKDEVGELAMTFNAMLARLQEAYQQVNQALKLQRDFVTDVSHELRTPLTTVRGNLALLRRKPPLPADEQDDILTDLVDESDRLIRLVNDLLVLAQADAGRGLIIAPVPVRTLIEEACRQAHLLDPGREIRQDAQDVVLRGDRDALKQVLLILLDNAVKHTRGDITVIAEQRGDQVELRVSDCGPGLSEEALQHVFNRFYRGEADQRIPGFGLGLAIAKALVEGQGGVISMESEPQSGSVVIIQLPNY